MLSDYLYQEFYIGEFNLIASYNNIYLKSDIHKMFNKNINK